MTKPTRIDLAAQPIVIPLDVAKCPSCDAQLILDIESWLDDADGIVKVGDFHCQCSKEPDFEAGAQRKKWEQHHALEYRQPYIYWLPVDQAVEHWLKTVEVVDSRIEKAKLERWNTWARQ